MKTAHPLIKRSGMFLGALLFTLLAMAPAVFAAVAITEHTVTPTPNSQPHGLTLGPDGNMWFVE